MGRKKKQLMYDVFFLLVSIAFAVYISETGIAHKFILSLGGLKWLGIILAGMFFTSIFTTAPSIILLGQFAETTPLLLLAAFGGLGAVLGDYIIFRFVRDRMAEDLKYLLSSKRPSRFSKIFKTKLFHFLVSFMGAIIIASPLPDEIGVAMLGFSKVKTKFFVILSFFLNGTGIFIVGFLANYIV